VPQPQAAHRYAFADAEVWPAVACAGAAARVAPGDLCDLYLGLGNVLLAGSGLVASHDAFERAIVLAREAGDPTRLATAVLGYAHRRFGFGATEATLGWLDVASASPSGHVALDARIASRLGAELLASSPENAARSDALFGASVRAARSFGDPFVLARVLTDVGASQFSARDPRAWLALHEEIEQLARRSGDVELEFRALVSRATGHLELGERDAVDELLNRARAFTSDHPMHYTRAVTLQMEAMCALLDGRRADARAAIDESEQAIRPMSSLGLLTLVAIQRFAMAVDDDGFEELLPALDAVRARFPALLSLTALTGLANALCGRFGVARAALDDVVSGLPRLPYDRARLPALVVAAETAYLLRNREAATALGPQLAPHAALSAVNGNASGYFGSVSQALGWTAAARGRTQEAIEHFQGALATHRALRSPPWIRRSTAAIAEVGQGRVRLLRA
jgi:tetratricopeptide (TPR) repeat protein